MKDLILNYDLEPRPPFWKRLLAFHRLNKRLVCELSKGRGLADDYHDYMDTEDQYPAHFTVLTCARCGKGFTI